MSDALDAAWDEALSTLCEHVAVPARSPMFDPEWETTGHIARAARLLRDWVASRSVRGATVVLIEPPGLTPVLLVEVAATRPGWAAPEAAPWLGAAIDEASRRHHDAPAAACGVGGTIPFMGMLGEQLPDAQFLLVGVLGPGSNAHGPDEFLHLPTARRLTRCVADVLEAHAAAS